MKRFHLIALVLFAGCVTRDSGCGPGNNSDDAESKVSRQYGVQVNCIADDENTYSCSDKEEKRMYRCADSASATGNIKCIPWFPLE